MLYRLSYGSIFVGGCPVKRGALCHTRFDHASVFPPLLTRFSRGAKTGAMSEENRPTLSDRGRAEADERKRRQAEALRANLQRRKAQGRARAEAEEGAPCPPGGGGVQDQET